MTQRANLEISGIKKSFGSMKAIESVDLVMKEGEFVSIIGPSGCGKSTLLDIAAGLLLPDEGHVYLNKENIIGQRGHAAYMPQKDVLLPWRTILDNVIVPLEIQGVKKEAARKEALDLLPMFGLAEFADRYPDELSGGMRQRASFLRTYLCKKEWLLLDEPFGKLDALTRLNMQKWLLDIWSQFRKSVLLITHDIDEAIFLSDRIYVFSPRPGRVIAEVNVNIKRPRTSKETTTTEFTAIKSELLELLGGN